MATKTYNGVHITHKNLVQIPCTLMNAIEFDSECYNMIMLHG